MLVFGKLGYETSAGKRSRNLLSSFRDGRNSVSLRWRRVGIRLIIDMVTESEVKQNLCHEKFLHVCSFQFDTISNQKRFLHWQQNSQMLWISNRYIVAIDLLGVFQMLCVRMQAALWQDTSCCVRLNWGRNKTNLSLFWVKLSKQQWFVFRERIRSLSCSGRRWSWLKHKATNVKIKWVTTKRSTKSKQHDSINLAYVLGVSYEEHIFIGLWNITFSAYPPVTRKYPSDNRTRHSTLIENNFESKKVWAHDPGWVAASTKQSICQPMSLCEGDAVGSLRELFYCEIDFTHFYGPSVLKITSEGIQV